MEIHYHPKHKSKSGKHSGKSKNKSSNLRKYKEYLFEFLVIFIAITGSFFAENLRDHFIDKHKEKEYMVSMLQDLKTDTASLDKIILENKEQVKGIDSLLKIMENDKSFNQIRLFCNYDLKYTSSYSGFIPVIRTIRQLMNTGGLRLVRSKSVTDGIVYYDNSVDAVLKQAELLDTRFIKILEQKTEIFDLILVKKLQQEPSSIKPKDYPSIISTDKKKMQTYYFNITIFKGTILGYTQRLETLNKQASSLVKLIQSEYMLK